MGTRQFFFNFLKLILPRARPRHSAIFFYFLKTYFAECKPWALGKFFFNFLKLILSSVSARHSVNFFFYFWKSTLPSAPGPALDKAHFAECPPWHSAIYFFYFGPKFFSVALWQYFKLYFKIWGNFDFFWYISLVYFVSSIFLGYFKFEPQVHGIMDFGHPKIDSHDI